VAFCKCFLESNCASRYLAMRSAAPYGMGHKPRAPCDEIPKAKYPTTGDGNVFQQHLIVRLLARPAS
jgi:hypothetical protein